MTSKLLLLAVLGVLLGTTLCVADDKSARRYAEMVAEDEMFRTFSLLERKDVQDELKVTPEQAARIKHICHPRNDEVPGLQELLDRYKKRRSDPATPAADRQKLNLSFSSDIGKCYEAYQSKELSATLSANQRQRLEELQAQMRGPITILDDPAISTKLRLSDKQRTTMADNIKDYEGKDGNLDWLRRRYGRQQISGLNSPETKEDRDKELEALFGVIRAIEMERDTFLLRELTPNQLASWRKVQGIPFPIAWPPPAIFDHPFGEKK